MKALRPDLELRLLVPNCSYHMFGTYQADRHAVLDAKEYIVMRRMGGRSHMTYLLNPVGLARFLRQFKADAVLIEEDPHSIIGVETVLLSRLFSPGTKVIFFVWDNLLRSPRFPLNLVKKAASRFSFAKTSLVVCGNTEGVHLLPKRGYAGPTAVVPQLGVTESGIAGDHGTSGPLIGFVGRLVPEKGVLLLLNALAKLKEFHWKLLIVGSGPLEREIQADWQDRFGDRLVLMKAVRHDEVNSILLSLDIFVLPSYGVPSWKEQFGLTLAQAMMAGVACIGSSSGAIPEVLGQAGVVFRERDEGALRDALRGLLESEEQRKRMASVARRRAQEQFSMSAVAARWLSAIDSVLYDVQ